MKSWWTSRTPRERLMIGALLALTSGLVLWFGVAAPLGAWSRTAAERYESAAKAAVTVDRAVSEIASLSRRAKAPASNARLEDAVGETAAAAGLSLTRLEPDPAGGVQVAIQGAEATTLFPWLAALQQTHGVVAAHLTVLKNDTAGLDVDATFVKVTR